jgi:hypothetical protein
MDMASRPHSSLLSASSWSLTLSLRLWKKDLAWPLAKSQEWPENEGNSALWKIYLQKSKKTFLTHNAH